MRMSSYKRIPKSLVKKAGESFSISDNYSGESKGYIEKLTNTEVENLKLRIENKEKELSEELEGKKESYIKQAYEEGFERAKEEVESDVLEKYKSILEEANSKYEEANAYHKAIIEQSEEIKKAYLDEKKEEILQIIVSCAKRMAYQHIEDKPENFEIMFEEILSQISYENKKIYVRMNPKTIQSFVQSKEAEVSKRIELLPDNNLEKFDLVIETERECIDARMENEIKQIEETIRGVILD